MANPTFNNLSLQDDTYITKQVEYRTRAPRRLESEVIARRIGKTLINEQIQEKIIILSGIILADNASGLQSAVDTLLLSVSSVENSLVIETGRTYTATARNVKIPDRTFTQTMVPFQIEFVANQPFSEAALQQAGFLVVSGVQSTTISTTISGNVDNRPTFTFVMPSGVGVSPIVEVAVQYTPTANTVTVSGIFNAETNVSFNYDNFTITSAGSSVDYIGQFDDIVPGDATFIVTVSGQNDGIRGTLEYNPRFW